MRLVWIGAGNVATQLGTALASAGHETLQVYSRTAVSAASLAARLGCACTTDVEQIMPGADVYLFSVKDSVLEELVARVAPRVGDGLCLHTAGSMPLSVFTGRAVRYGVLYPMQTFSRNRAVDFRDIPCFVEASDAVTLEQVKALAGTVSGRVVEMDSARRRYLHLAAVFACNFTNHCYAMAERILAAQDIPFDVMLPLVDETARKVHELPPHDAQTGPAVRFDENVMARHLELLDGTPEYADIYRMMSEGIHREALRDGV